jgi:hypothetical protein
MDIRNIALALTGAIAVAGAAQAQSPYRPPHLANGQPDLQGVWQNPQAGPGLEPGGLGDKLVVTPQEAVQLSKTMTAGSYANPATTFQSDLPPDYEALSVRGELRTRLLVQPADGKMPYTQAAETAANLYFASYTKIRNEGAADPELLDLSLRCLTLGGIPFRFAGGLSQRQIVQSSAGVAILSEDGGELRNIRMGGDFQPAAVRSLMGDSVGHWEDNVLVVETRNFSTDYPNRTLGRDRPVVLGPESRLIERFWRVSANELDYSFTVIDPTLYSAPWLAEYAMTRSSDIIHESACHEGNYAMAMILQGARDEEAASGVKISGLR